MATNFWAYTSNQFDRVTRGSFKLMNELSADHRSRLLGLATDVELQNIANAFNLVRFNFKEGYQLWKHLSDAYQGATKRLELMMVELSGEKIEDWDVRIQNVYKTRTAEYKAILSDGRTPFQRMPYEQRINMVGTLVKNLEMFPDLADLRNDVIIFYEDLVEVRDMQEQLEGRVKDSSMALERLRKTTATAMYKNLGLLMAKFAEDPTQVEKFFDLEKVQRTSNNDEESEIDPTAVLGVNPGSTADSGLSIAPETVVLLRNRGPATVRFCLGTTGGIPCNDGTGLVVQPGEEITATPGELGRVEGGILNVTNLSTGIAGEVEVYLG